ncbi:hypothetical protein Cgig2_005200 [Carnegiea gigantea]|uniref:Uncharacterized protein n=1 Tax=Carnegiea gigantea TaxID=171969 RepID=A0A9Q1QJ99_9CARY|nr:hypothetical protein Cgig2_005200 [Carnegiea gigantea]
MHRLKEIRSTILQFAEQSIDPAIRASTFSPRLMETCFLQAIIWFLARWSGTYLMAPEASSNCDRSSIEIQRQHSRKALFDFFGQHNQGKFVLDLIVRISMTALISYPGEKDLQELTCRHLLHGLVRRRDICMQLVSLPKECLSSKWLLPVSESVHSMTH